MSNPNMAMEETLFEGYVKVGQTNPPGMITLRGKFGSKTYKNVLQEAIGTELPNIRQLIQGDDRSVAWMSTDELLILCSWEDKAALVAALQKALGKRHSMVIDVSDAFKTFTLKGTKVREVIAKFAPVDLSPDSFKLLEVRRTRFGQIAATIWLTSQEEAIVICSRSVGDYMFKQLKAAVRPGSEVGIWN